MSSTDRKNNAQKMLSPIDIAPLHNEAAAVTCVRTSPDGKRIAIALISGAFLIIKNKPGDEVVAATKDPGRRCNHLSWTPDSRALYTSHFPHQFWALHHHHHHHQSNHHHHKNRTSTFVAEQIVPESIVSLALGYGSVRCNAISACGCYVACAGSHWGSQLCIFDVSRGALKSSVQLGAATRPTAKSGTSVAFVGNGSRHLVCGTDAPDSRLFLLTKNLGDEQIAEEDRQRFSCCDVDNVKSVAVSPDGSKIAVLGFSWTLFVSTGKRVLRFCVLNTLFGLRYAQVSDTVNATLMARCGGVEFTGTDRFDVRWSPSGAFIACATPKALFPFHADSGEVASLVEEPLAAPFHTLDFVSPSRQLVVGSESGVWLWDTTKKSVNPQREATSTDNDDDG